jgi:radical SAM superfamily enzyme YgiQ (UPF0313 family)
MRVLLANVNRNRDLLPPPPIGLSYVASAAAAAGHQVRLVDLRFAGSPERRLRRLVREERPGVVGLSIRNLDNLVRERQRPEIDPVRSLVEAARAGSDAAVVLGGSAISIAGASALARVGADYAIAGDGEAAFVALLAALEGRGSLDDVPGLLRRREGAVTATTPPRSACFGASGMERWLDWRPYARAGSTWGIQTKRGCPLDCAYCLYGVIEGGAHRLREAADVVEEIARVQRAHRPRTFEFVDSTFNLPPAHAQALCEAIAASGLRVSLTAQGINPLGASPGLFAAMRAAGFNSFMVSAEAGCDRMLHSLRKGFTMEHVHRTREAARASGMVSLWFFMLGAPGEDEQSVEETCSFIERYLDWNGCLAVIFTGVRILPHTEVARRAVEEGQLEPDADLVLPRFYFSPRLDEARLRERIRRTMALRPAVVRAAEEDAAVQRVMSFALSRLGVAPPYWRFLPPLLRSFPIRQLRVLGGAEPHPPDPPLAEVNPPCGAARVLNGSPPPER